MRANRIRPTKEQAIKAAIQVAPQYSALLRDMQKDYSHQLFSSEIFKIQDKLGRYVLIYDDELKIGRALFLCLMGEEGYKEFAAETNASSPEEQQELIEQMAELDMDEIEDALAPFEIPGSPKEWDDARAAAALLPESDRLQLEKRGAFFWSYFFSSFFNTLSLMVHGSKMTALVPRALLGDEEAFLKAVHIDRMLILHHPYFRQRKIEAQDNGETEFLSKLAYREMNSPLKGKIQFPALYMVFGILEAFQWLDDLRHAEILDICDKAGLDRYQNRIEDVGYLTKRLIEYRKWQKVVGMSMQ